MSQPSKYHRAVWIGLASGLSIHLLFTRWYAPPLALSHSFNARFEWDSGHGFKSFTVEDNLLGERGGSVWQYLVAAQVKPRLASCLKEGHPRFGNASGSPEQDVAKGHKDLGRASHQWPRIDGSDYLVTDPRVPPLIRAIAAGNDERASKLIASGADPNAADPYGLTALMVAANRGQTALIPKLLAAGANINVKSQEGETALFGAAFVGDLGTLKVLIAHGADVNATSKLGITPLMAGAQHSKAAIEFLLANGANVNATDILGGTALMMAASAGRADVVRVLIRARADVNAKDKLGQTALSGARSAGYAGVVRLLKRAGARE